MAWNIDHWIKQHVQLHHLLGLVFSIFFLVHMVWFVQSDKLPPVWDEARHMTDAYQFSDALFGDGKEGLEGHYGPFVSVASVPFQLLFGREKLVLVLTNMVFVVILLFSVFSIGKRIGGYSTGLGSMVLASFMPLIFGLSKVFLLDFALTSMVSLCFALLLRLNIEHLKEVLVFGLVLSFTLLVKLNAVLFLGVPTCVVFLFSLRGKQRSKVVAHSLLLLALVAVFLSLGYAGRGSSHLFGPGRLATDVKDSFLSPDRLEFMFTTPYFLQNLFGHLVQLSGSQTNMVVFLLFIYGLVRLRYRLFHTRDLPSWILLLWFVVPFLFVSFFLSRDFHVDTRYLTPVVPLMVVVAVATLLRMKWRIIVGILLGIFTLISFLLVAYDIDVVPFARDFPLHTAYSFDDYNCWLSRPPLHQEWPMQNLLNEIPLRKENAVVGVLADSAVFNWETLHYYAVWLQKNITFLDCPGDVGCFGKKPDAVLGSEPLLLPHTDPFMKERVLRAYDAFPYTEYTLVQQYPLRSVQGHRCGFVMNADINLFWRITDTT